MTWRRIALGGLVLVLALTAAFVRADVAGLNRRIDALEASLASKDTELSNVRRQLEDARGESLSLQGQASSRENQIADLRSKLRAKRPLLHVVGQKVGHVRRTLEGYGWTVRVRRVASAEPVGAVLAQSPPAGTLMKLGKRVTLTVAKPLPPPPPACPPYNSNPYGFCFEVGSLIYNPPSDFCLYFDCIGNFWNGRGYVIQCQDGEFSKSGGIQGSCSYHGGNSRALLDP